MADSNAKKLAQFLTSSGTYNLYDVQADSTGFFDLPTGTTAQRPTAVAGMIRYNSTLSLAEYYDGTGWKSIDSPPVVSSISPSNIADSDSSVDITITGSFFASGATVKAIGTDLSEIAAASVTFNSATELVANFDGTDFDDANEDYDIEVTNPSGLAGKGNDLLSVNASPVFTTAAGSLGTITDSTRSSYSLSTAAATDDENDSLTYSVSVGSLPSGLSLNTSTGAITGTADAVGSDTTSTFTISVTDGTNTNTRQFSITVNAPVITSYTSTGSGTFSVPSGVSSVDVLVVAGGGGGGGYYYAGGGGAGGLVYRPAFPVTPGGSVSYSVGQGGSGGSGGGHGSNGQDSSFGTLTAKGGGYGVSAQPGANNGGPGGSGGGATSSTGGTEPRSGGTATQPQQPGDSSTYGFGNPGGACGGGGAGGGGAGQAGNPSVPLGGAGAAGGDGKAYSISGSSVYYAGGGGGSADVNQSSANGASGGNGGGGNGSGASPWAPNPTAAQSGTANRGGGGGGASHNSDPVGANGGSGGSGIVIVKY